MLWADGWLEDCMPGVTWKTSELAILQKNPDLSAIDLSLLLDRTVGAIRLKRWSLGESFLRGRPRTHSETTHYFQTIDSPEKAYWLGVLWADGRRPLRVEDRVQQGPPMKREVNLSHWLKKGGLPNCVELAQFGNPEDWLKRHCFPSRLVCIPHNCVEE